MEIGSVSTDTDRNLLFGAACTRRCAGEGELVFEFTQHGVTLAKTGDGVNR